MNPKDFYYAFYQDPVNETYVFLSTEASICADLPFEYLLCFCKHFGGKLIEVKETPDLLMSLKPLPFETVSHRSWELVEQWIEQH